MRKAVPKVMPENSSGRDSTCELKHLKQSNMYNVVHHLDSKNLILKMLTCALLKYLKCLLTNVISI